MYIYIIYIVFLDIYIYIYVYIDICVNNQHHLQLGVELCKSKNNFHPINKKRKDNNQPNRKSLSQNHKKYATKNTFPTHHKSMPQKNTFPKHQTPVQQLWTLDIKLPFNKHQHPFQQLFGWINIVELLLMAEIRLTSL